jgi:hypothetical protein
MRRNVGASAQREGREVRVSVWDAPREASRLVATKRAADPRTTATVTKIGGPPNTIAKKIRPLSGVGAGALSSVGRLTSNTVRSNPVVPISCVTDPTAGKTIIAINSGADSVAILGEGRI